MANKIVEEDYYYQLEFEEIQKSNEKYKGQWNWYSFLFTWIWCFYKGCTSIGITILIILYLAVNSGLNVFGLHGISLLPLWWLVVSIVMGLNGTWYLYNIKVKNKKLSDLFIMFIAKTLYNRNLKKILVAGLILVIPVGFLVHYLNQKEDEKWRNELNSTAPAKKDKQQSDNNNICEICHRSFKGRGYEEVSDGIWKLCQEPYQCYICSKSCGLKHTREMNGFLNTKNTLNDNNGCPLCKGTGIEKNNSHLTNEYGRKCPMCNGKGVRSY